MAFGVYIYSLVGLLIVVLLWVLFTSVSYDMICVYSYEASGPCAITIDCAA